MITVSELRSRRRVRDIRDGRFGALPAALYRVADLMDARDRRFVEAGWSRWRNGTLPRPTAKTVTTLSGKRVPADSRHAWPVSNILMASTAQAAAYGLASMRDYGRAWDRRVAEDGKAAARARQQECRDLYEQVCRALRGPGLDAPDLTSDDVRALADRLAGGGS